MTYFDSGAVVPLYVPERFSAAARAAAHLALCETFVSADDRQLAVAKASGLSTIDIKRTRRCRKR